MPRRPRRRRTSRRALLCVPRPTLWGSRARQRLRHWNERVIANLRHRRCLGWIAKVIMHPQVVPRLRPRCWIVRVTANRRPQLRYRRRRGSTRVNASPRLRRRRRAHRRPPLFTKRHRRSRSCSNNSTSRHNRTRLRLRNASRRHRRPWLSRRDVALTILWVTTRHVALSCARLCVSSVCVCVCVCVCACR